MPFLHVFVLLLLLCVLSFSLSFLALGSHGTTHFVYGSGTNDNHNPNQPPLQCLIASLVPLFVGLGLVCGLGLVLAPIDF